MNGVDRTAVRGGPLMTMRSLTADDLVATFSGAVDAVPRVGLELETGLVDPATGASVDYFGPRGSRRLLSVIRHEFGGSAVTEDGAFVGVELPNGARFSLELGCALEYSSAPLTSLGEVIEATRRDVGHAAELARRLDVALLPVGLLPFTPIHRIPWIPKTRVMVMREFFRDLGPAGRLAEGVMGLALSTQTTIDYLSSEDLVEKLRLLALASPIAAAVFVNSPLEFGAPTGVLSRRMHRWERVDASRCGVMRFAVDSTTPIPDMISWALRLPMIYRLCDGEMVRAPGRTFEQLIGHGFGDGTWPSMDDWDSHLSQVWPHVRLRRTLESRAFDGLGWPMFAAAPAFWIGLAYNDVCRREALALLAGITATELERLTRDVAVEGLSARVGGRPVAPLAQRLVDLADRGLRARVDRGLEPDWVPELLDPLRDVLRTRTTFAERCLFEWFGVLDQHPAAFVDAHRI